MEQEKIRKFLDKENTRIAIIISFLVAGTYVTYHAITLVGVFF